jgi:hypothetical protein
MFQARSTLLIAGAIALLMAGAGYLVAVRGEALMLELSAIAALCL